METNRAILRDHIKGLCFAICTSEENPQVEDNLSILNIINESEHNFYDHIMEVKDSGQVQVHKLPFLSLLNIYKVLENPNAMCGEFCKSIKTFCMNTPPQNILVCWIYSHLLQQLLIIAITGRKTGLKTLKKNIFRLTMMLNETFRFILQQNYLIDIFYCFNQKFSEAKLINNEIDALRVALWSVDLLDKYEQKNETQPQVLNIIKVFQKIENTFPNQLIIIRSIFGIYFGYEYLAKVMPSPQNPEIKDEELEKLFKKMVI